MNSNLPTHAVLQYDTNTGAPDVIHEVTATDALDAIRQTVPGIFMQLSEYTSISRLDYWQEKNPSNPVVSAADNAHCQYDKRGSRGIAAWRIR